MRKPSPPSSLFAWWRASISGARRLSVIEDEPQCGFYQTQLVKSGPMVPIKIWMHQRLDEHGQLAEDEYLRCTVNLVEISEGQDEIIARWPYFAKRPITRERYTAMVEAIRTAEMTDLDSPLLHPRQPISEEKRKELITNAR